MTDWDEQRHRLVASFDAVADIYHQWFANELDHKPFDRHFLERFAARTDPDGLVLEVGAGPGHVADHLVTRDVAVLVSDASTGQLRQARLRAPHRPLLATDLARLPLRPTSVAGIVAFYCLIYGPPEHLDGVFADWRRALRPGGLVAVAVHAGQGLHHAGEWFGRTIDVTIAYRDPDDLRRRLESAGFAIDELTVRRPYPGEGDNDRCYVLATARAAATE